MRVSIRYKLLLVLTALLVAAIGSYLALATSLFTQDKLAYVFDLNSSLVETLSEQTRATVTVMSRTLAMFTRDVSRRSLTPDQQEQLAKELFALEPDLVRVEVYASQGTDTPLLKQQFVNAPAAKELGLAAADFEAIRKRRPIPLAAVSAEPQGVYLHNSSLPPDAALLTLAVALPQADGQVVVAADFRHDRLLRIFGRSKLHEAYLLDERGEVLAHPDASQVLDHGNFSTSPLVREALTGTAAQGVREFAGPDGAQQLGAYARVGVGRLTVFAQVPKAVALGAARELLQRSTLFAVAVLLLAIVASVVFSRLLTGPIRKLRAGAELLGKGQFDVDLSVQSRDEIGDLAAAFRQMARELKDAQASLVQSEKMAAFGQLGAGLTHEIKNPMTGIIGLAQLAQRKLNDPVKLAEMLKLIETEGLRCKDTLVNFLKFARGEEGAPAGVVDVNTVVQDSGKLFSHQLGMHGVKVKLQLGEGVPPITGSPNQLQQVLLNLAINAQQALGGKGVVEIGTRTDESGFVEIAFSDDGPGIPAELQEKVFEPFFTTKKPGEGSGLGLAICRRILQDHGGTMTLHSAAGQGTRFMMRIPPAQKPPMPS